MGRPAFSDELHKLHGTKPQSKAATESHVRAGRPSMPADIRRDPNLRATFKRIVKLLGDRRALSKGDVELIRLYAYAFDRHKENVERLRAEGDIVAYERLDSHGNPHTFYKENLRLKIVVAAAKEMAALLGQLGMSPTAKDRARPTSGIAVQEYAPGTIGYMKAHGELKVMPIKTVEELLKEAQQERNPS